MTNFIGFLFFIVLLTFSIYSHDSVYKNLKENEITFRGVESRDIDINLLDCIPIGLFVPAGKNILGNEILKGVQFAIDEENEKGGFGGKKFCIKRRWSNDTWGSGSKDVIDLIYKDHVLGIIAYKDGAGHIALQIAAKINIPVLSPVTTDLSLTMTGVPWIFRLPPDDRKQAEILYKNGIKKKSLKRLGIISELDHDVRVSTIEILKVLKTNKNPPVFHINIKKSQNEIQLIFKKIEETKPDGIILVLKRNNFLDLLSLLKKNKIRIPVFSTWNPEIRKSQLKKTFPFLIYSIEPFSLDISFFKAALNLKYLKRYKTQMTYSAIYSYDGTKMLINVIKKYGLNRSKIRKGLKELSGYKGISGKIIWDNSGGNKIYPKLTFGRN